VGAGDRAGGGHPADDTTFGMMSGQNYWGRVTTNCTSFHERLVWDAL
jgi:hypothetical protein